MKDLRQLFEHLLRLLRLLRNECRGGVERIEEKVRIDLCAQRLQLGLRRADGQLLFSLFRSQVLITKPLVFKHRTVRVHKNPEQLRVFAEKGDLVGSWKDVHRSPDFSFNAHGSSKALRCSGRCAVDPIYANSCSKDL